MVNRANLTVFHKAENVSDIFTCYVVTYQNILCQVLVPSQYKKTVQEIAVRNVKSQLN